MDIRDQLADAVSKVESILSEAACVRVLSHIDADGLSSAGIACRYLFKRGVFFHYTPLKQLERSMVSSLASVESSAYDVVMLLDLGSAHVDALSSVNKPVIVIDHHQVPNLSQPENVVHVNAWMYSVNGGLEVSSSGLTYLIFSSLQSDPDSAVLALAGAMGDLQDKGEKGSFLGVNREILEECVRLGVVRQKLDLRLSGGSDTPLLFALLNTSNPFIPGLTGDESRCYKFLYDLGIQPFREERWTKLSDLSDSEKKRLATELVKYMIAVGLSEEEAKSIFGYTYPITEKSSFNIFHDLRSMSETLNACGKMGHGALAILASISPGLYADRCREIMSSYREDLRKAISLLMSNRESRIVKAAKAVFLLGASDIRDTIISTVTTIMSGFREFSYAVAVVGLARSDDGKVKISARLTPSRTAPNLGAIMREVCSRLGGEGGGHAQAAGGQIPHALAEKFMEMFEEALERLIQQ
ncbi:MAG: hypothetical protein DRN99_03550 [Thermoproteota archaeon]|nr:MAG: hypothetical protein DRN99_03550 [Candidatus Korarchaeota archaeon]